MSRKKTSGEGETSATYAEIPSRWDLLKPKCKGCRYQGTAIPCEYLLITGKTPQSQGAHIDPNGPGGCELYDAGKRTRQVVPIAIPPREKVTREKPSILDKPEFFELHRSGAADREIADRAGVSDGTVKKWRARHGLKSNRRQGFQPSVLDCGRTMELYEQGLLDDEIGSHFGRSGKAVAAWRKRNGLPSNRSKAAKNLREK